MECRAVINSLSEYLDSQNTPSTVNWISDDEVEQIETHLDNCPSCQNFKLELSEIKTAARELPLHTPPRAMWTRISNVIGAEISAETAPLQQTQNASGWWGRLKTRKFTFSFPQLATGSALALALIIAGNSGIFIPQSGTLNFSGAQSALLLPDEREIKAQLERRMDAVNARKAKWDPQRRDEFEQRMVKIDESLNRCRYMLKDNPRDAVNKEMELRGLYNEKRQLLEDVERLKW